MIIELFIKTYAHVLWMTGLFFCLTFLLGCYWIIHRAGRQAEVGPDLSSIAGEDVVSTQLDLARAYIETKNATAAKTILKAILAQGNTTQKKAARTLLDLV
jgi:FimV-like protein